MPTIVSGDSNLHHLNWDVMCQHPSPLAQDFIQWAEDNDLVIVNDPEQPTWRHRNNSASSVIDLVLTNSHLERLDCFHHFYVDETRAWTSDHHSIFWTIDFAPARVENPLGIKYNFKHVLVLVMSLPPTRTLLSCFVFVFHDCVVTVPTFCLCKQCGLCVGVL